jgi:propanol-preferring alcohol dehydrogenase
MAECLALAADGKVKADIELSQLSSINEILGRLERGDVASRVVLDFAGAKHGTNAEEHGKQLQHA